MPRPILDAAIGIALLSIMDAVIKGLVARYPVAEVAFIRYLVGSVVMALIAARLRPGWPRPETIRANALRAVLVVVTALTFYTALGLLPLAETLILSFISPIFTAVFASLVLGERADLRIVGSLAAGFAGVLVIVLGGAFLSNAPAGAAGPVVERSLLGVAAVLVSAVTYAASNVLLRARAQRDPVVVIVAIQNAAPCLMLAVPAALLGRLPEAADLPALGAVGLLGVSGHLMLARAYARAEAMRLAALDYTALIWAVLIGFAVYDEVPTAPAIMGAVLILGAALASSRRRSPRCEREITDGSGGEVSSVATEPDATVEPSLAELFLGFAAVASLAFGGVLPWARFVLVEKRRWLTADEFLDMLALCQLLPGPNIGNLSIAVGAKFHGAAGSIAAMLGLFLVPITVVLGLATLYARFVGVPAVQHALAGMAAAAAGLVVGMAVKLLEPLLRRQFKTALPVVVAVFAAVGLMQWPLWPVVLVAGPAAILIAMAARP